MNWRVATASVLDACKTTFGETVVYLHSSGESETITGVFSETYVLVDPETGVPVQSRTPGVMVKLADLSTDPDAQDQVTVRGIDYEVVGFQPDGEGGALLLLHKL